MLLFSDKYCQRHYMHLYAVKHIYLRVYICIYMCVFIHSFFSYFYTNHSILYTKAPYFFYFIIFTYLNILAIIPHQSRNNSAGDL